MATGTVKFYNATKGYGFIQPDEGGNDVFFHVTALEQAGMAAPAEGDKLTYEIEHDDRRGKSFAANLAQAS